MIAANRMEERTVQKRLNEVEAIEGIRSRNPQASQKGLARQIAARNFNDPQDRTASANVVGRPFLSIYSVIRRYDTRINKAVQRVNAVVQQHMQPATAGAL
jgi:hypothetical protein